MVERVPAVNRLSEALIADLPSVLGTITNLRNTTERFDNYDCVDLGHFLKQLASNASISTQVQEYAQQASDALSKVVVREAHGSSHPNAHGLAVYFPKTSKSYEESYTDPNQILFANEKWDDFLRAYRN